LQGEARFTVLPGGERLQLQVNGLPATAQGQTLAFYPESSDTFRHAAELGKDWTQAWKGATWTAELPLSEMRGDTPPACRWCWPAHSGQRCGPCPAHPGMAHGGTGRRPVESRAAGHRLPALAAALEANRNAATPAAPGPQPARPVCGWRCWAV
jgi:thiol:disulfide interchange protein DsbD